MKPYYNEQPLWNNEHQSHSSYSDFIFCLSSLCISFIKPPFSFLPIDLATNSQMSFYSRIPNNSRPLLWPHSLSQSWSRVSAHGHIISIIGSLFSLVVVFSLSLMPSHSGTYHPQSLGQLLLLAFKATPAGRPNVSIHADLSSVYCECECLFVHVWWGSMQLAQSFPYAQLFLKYQCLCAILKAPIYTRQSSFLFFN